MTYLANFGPRGEQGSLSHTKIQPAHKLVTDLLSGVKVLPNPGKSCRSSPRHGKRRRESSRFADIIDEKNRKKRARCRSVPHLEHTHQIDSECETTVASSSQSVGRTRSQKFFTSFLSTEKGLLFGPMPRTMVGGGACAEGRGGGAHGRTSVDWPKRRNSASRRARRWGRPSAWVGSSRKFRRATRSRFSQIPHPRWRNGSRLTSMNPHIDKAIVQLHQGDFVADPADWLSRNPDNPAF